MIGAMKRTLVWIAAAAGLLLAGALAFGMAAQTIAAVVGFFIGLPGAAGILIGGGLVAAVVVAWLMDRRRA